MARKSLRDSGTRPEGQSSRDSLRSKGILPAPVTGALILDEPFEEIKLKERLIELHRLEVIELMRLRDEIEKTTSAANAMNRAINPVRFFPSGDLLGETKFFPEFGEAHEVINQE